MLVGQMVVKFAADLTNLTAGVRNSQSQMRNFASTTQSSMAAVASAQNKAEEAAHKLELAQAQAAVALKKASDMANSGKATAEQQAIANARAAIAADKVRNAQISLTSAQERAQNVAQQLSNAEDEVANSSERAATASSHMSLSLGNVRTSVTSTISKVVEFASHLTTVIGGIKDLADGAIELGKKLLEPNASLEQSRVSFKAFLGDMRTVNKVLKDLQSFAATTPFEFPEIQQASLKLLNMGVQAKDLTRYLTQVGDAVSKVGGTGADLNDVITVLSQMSMAGRITTQDMLQLSNKNIPAFQLLANAMHVPVSTLREMISNGELGKDKIDLLIQSMGQFGNGAMVDQGRTFNGLLSTVRDNATQALAAFTGPLFDMAKGNLDKLGQLVSSPQFQQFAKDMGEKVGTALSNIGNFIQTTVIPGFQQLRDWGQNIAKAFQSPEFQNMVTSFQNLGNTVGTILMPALKPLGELLSRIFSGAGGKEQASGLAGAFQTVANAVNGLNGFVIFMRDQVWPRVWPILVQIGGFLASTFGPAFQQVSQIVQTQLMPAFQRLWQAIQPALPLLQGLAMLVGGILLIALGLFIGFISGVVSAIAGALPGIILWFSGLVQFVTGLIQFFSGFVSFIVDLFTGNFSKLGADLQQIWAGISNMFQGGLNVVKGLFMAVLGWITGFIGGWISAIVGFFTNLWNTLVHHSIIPDMINEIIQWFQNLGPRALSAIQSFISGAISRLTNFATQARNKAQDAVNNIRDKLAALPGQALTWGQNLISSFANGIRNTIGQVTQAAQDVASTIGNILGIHSPAKEGPLTELMKWPVNLVRSYADQMSTNRPLIERAVDDLVQPTTALNGRAALNMSASGTGATVGGGRGQQTIIIELDGKEIGRTVNDYQARELRVQGVIRR